MKKGTYKAIYEIYQTVFNAMTPSSGRKEACAKFKLTEAKLDRICEIGYYLVYRNTFKNI